MTEFWKSKKFWFTILLLVQSVCMAVGYSHLLHVCKVMLSRIHKLCNVNNELPYSHTVLAFTQAC